MLDEIFNDGIFDKIGKLDIMPQKNQVLQKREGYSQIFSAYSMIDLALRLNWSGHDDVYLSLIHICALNSMKSTKVGPAILTWQQQKLPLKICMSYTKMAY